MFKTIKEEEEEEEEERNNRTNKKDDNKHGTIQRLHIKKLLTTSGLLQTIFCSERMQHSLSSLVALSVSLQHKDSPPKQSASPLQEPPKHCLKLGVYNPATMQQQPCKRRRSPMSTSVCSSVDSIFISAILLFVFLSCVVWKQPFCGGEMSIQLKFFEIFKYFVLPHHVTDSHSHLAQSEKLNLSSELFFKKTMVSNESNVT